MTNIVKKAARCLQLHATERRMLFISSKDVVWRCIANRTWSSTKPDQDMGVERKDQESTSDKKEEISEEALRGEEILKLNEKLTDMKDKYQRSIAENENVRKRLRKEISDAKLYAVQGFCKDLLDVADVLSTAIHSVPEEVLQVKSDPDHKKWTDFYDGVTLTKSELLAVFKRHGLEPFTPGKGDKFDPNIHQAMFQAPIDGMESGLVAHVQQTGYMLHGRTLRPAQVGVSK